MKIVWQQSTYLIDANESLVMRSNCAMIVPEFDMSAGGDGKTKEIVNFTGSLHQLASGQVMGERERVVHLI